MTGLPDLRALAEQRDLEGQDVYLSLYADATDAWQRALEARRHAIEDADHAIECWDEAMAELERALGHDGARGAAVFWHLEEGEVNSCSLAAPVDTQAVLDSSPYVRPLARFADEHAAFLLVLLDGEGATIHTVEEGETSLESSKGVSLAGRHTKGGWSQMRFQRARQGAVDRYLDDVADALGRLVRSERHERIALAGPGEAKRRFRGRLPKELADLVFVVEDTEGLPLRRLQRLAQEDEEQRSLEVLDELRGAAKRGELYALGAFDCVRAAAAGAVETLVVQKGAIAGGAKRESDESYHALGDAPEDATEVDLIEEAVEHVLRTAGSMEFVPAEAGWLERHDGVGAILRWDMTNPS